MQSVLKISEASSLAVHAMSMLAALPEKIFTTNEIAAGLASSEAHLSKVLQRLAKSGYVKSVRGPKGGYILAGDPAAITLLEIFEDIEGRIAPASCVYNEKLCDCTNCLWGGLISKINFEFKNYLAKTKLAGQARLFNGGNSNEG